MELDDFKKAWTQYSATKSLNSIVTSSELEAMIGKRTNDISRKIGKNIRIGLAIALAWSLLGFTVDFILNPIMKQYFNTPNITDQILLYSFIVQVFIYLLIFSTLILFWYKFNQIDKRPIDYTKLNDTLKSYIRVISAYKKMFYIILALVLTYVAVAFTTGFCLGYSQGMQSSGLKITDISMVQWIITIVSFLLTLGVFVAIYLLLFNWFFKRLYGRHLVMLKSTLRELNEGIHT